MISYCIFNVDLSSPVGNNVTNSFVSLPVEAKSHVVPSVRRMKYQRSNMSFSIVSFQYRAVSTLIVELIIVEEFPMILKSCATIHSTIYYDSKYIDLKGFLYTDRTRHDMST